MLKVKSPIFIDRVTFELDHSDSCLLKAVLKDDSGCICSALETITENQQDILNWNGLNDLPYGVYYLEVQHGENEARMRLVKRV